MAKPWAEMSEAERVEHLHRELLRLSQKVDRNNTALVNGLANIRNEIKALATRIQKLRP